MKSNMGTIDRSIRVIFAAAVAVLYFLGAISGVAAAVLGGLAAIMVVTSLVSFCPLYLPIGLSTCRKEEKPESEAT